MSLQTGHTSAIQPTLTLSIIILCLLHLFNVQINKINPDVYSTRTFDSYGSFFQRVPFILHLLFFNFFNLLIAQITPTLTALSHVDKRNTYVRMLFIDYSSAFNTIVPSKLHSKTLFWYFFN